MKTRSSKLRGWGRILGSGALALVVGEGAFGAEKDFTWGHEEAPEGRSVVIDPPYLTPDPARVEVALLYWYPQEGFVESEALGQKWIESLPAGVDVVRYPVRALTARRARAMSQEWRERLERYQQALFVARFGGREEPVHRALVERVSGGQRHAAGLRVARRVLQKFPSDQALAERVRELERRHAPLDSDADIKKLLREQGVSDADIERFYRGPEVAGLKLLVGHLGFSVGSTSIRSGLAAEGSSAGYPMLVINGRYGIDEDIAGSTQGAFRVANRLIREELERGRAHEGPTNDEAFAEWMAPRSGEMLWGQGVRGVYNHWRREFWELDDEGKVQRVSRLVGEGDASAFELRLPGHTVHVPMWRAALRFRPYPGRARYGAFLLMDQLAAPETHWVELSWKLPWKRVRVALAFSPDGTVEARNEEGPIFGSWWLEAGELHVSLGELGVRSWPWEEVAREVGFEAPPVNPTPWKS